MSMVGKIAFWMAGERVQSIRRTAVRWWDEVAGWLRTANDFNDALTVAMPIVDLLAYQRGIDRFRAEPEWLYRLRVHHAYRNWIDAGTRAGMERIFERLEMPVYGLAERLAGYDWDMIKVEATLADYIRAADALHIVMQAYRRTCRRWLIEVQSPAIRGTTYDSAAGFVEMETHGTDVLQRHTAWETAVGFCILETT